MGADAARRRLEEQEDLSIEQQTAQQYKAFEAAQRAKLEEQEDLSIEQQMAQQVSRHRAADIEQQVAQQVSRQATVLERGSGRPT